MTAFHPDQLARPSIDGPATTVSGWDGAILATFTRRVAHSADRPLMVVAVAGDVDQDTAPLLRAGLLDALDGWSRVCCDLGDAAFFGAAGVNTVLAAHRHAAVRGHGFALRGVHGVAHRVLRLAGLDEMVTVGR